MAGEWVPIGDRLDALGVRAELEEGDLVASAVVVLTVLREGDWRPRLTLANSDRLGWIEQIGLLRAAERICSEPPDGEEP